jgi:hypothetical protein
MKTLLILVLLLLGLRCEAQPIIRNNYDTNESAAVVEAIQPQAFTYGVIGAVSALTNFNWAFQSNTVQEISTSSSVFLKTVSGGPGLSSIVISNSGSIGSIIQIGIPTNAMALTTNLSSGAVFSLNTDNTNWVFNLTNEAGRVVYISANKLTSVVTGTGAFHDIVYSCGTSLP